MFHWITKIIISASMFLGITSPIVSPTPLVDLTSTSTVVVSDRATPKPTLKQITKPQIPTPSTTTILTPTPIPTQIQIQASTPTPVVYTETQTMAKDFLSNPTLDSLKVFCEKAKNIPSLQTKEVLNDDKTAIKLVNIPLSETIQGCGYLNNPNSGVVFISPTSTSLLINLCAEDTDTLRVTIIKWNNKMREYNQTYKLYGFNNSYRGLSGTHADDNTNYQSISNCPENDKRVTDAETKLYQKRALTFIGVNKYLITPEVEIEKLVK
jgi:hypothetical protein